MWTKKDSQNVWTHPKTVDVQTAAGNVAAGESPVGDIPDSQLPGKGWRRGHELQVSSQITGPQCHVYRIPIFSARLSGMQRSFCMLSCIGRPRRLDGNFFLFSVKKKSDKIPPKLICYVVYINALRKILQPTVGSIFLQISSSWKSNVILD